MRQSYEGFFSLLLVHFFCATYRTPYADRIEARKWSKHSLGCILYKILNVW